MADAPSLRPSPEEGRPGGVVVEDESPTLIRNASDLLGAVLCVGAVVLTLLLTVYGHGTTTGVAADVRGFDRLVGQLLVVPVVVLSRLVVVAVPIAALTELVLRRRPRQLVLAIVGAAAAGAACWTMAQAIAALGSPALVRGISVAAGNRLVPSVPVALAVLAGLLTGAGPRERQRTVGWSWAAVWTVVAVSLVTGQASLMGTVLALLVGRGVGLAMRYGFGLRPDRAFGADLVDALRRAGYSPSRLIRLRVPEERAYRLETTDGRGLRLSVLDPDRQVTDALARLWQAVLLRGLEARPFATLRAAAEHRALLSFLVRAGGARAPAVHAIIAVKDSVVLVEDDTDAAVPLDATDPARLDDGVLDEIWAQLIRAHAQAVAHRAVSGRTVLVDVSGARPVVWLTGWDAGIVAAPEILRQVDVVQLLAALALRVGVSRAVASARRAMPGADLGALGPFFQPVALPAGTRAELRQRREVQQELRALLSVPTPSQPVERPQLVRMTGRQVLSTVLAAAAVVVVLTTINVDQIAAAVTSSDWRLGVVALILGLLTFVGVATTYVALSPVPLPFGLALQVQVAASFVALAAPAGLGPPALNARMLTRRGVETPLAVATVALVQVSQFVVTALVVVVLALLAGATSVTSFGAGPETLVIVLVVVGVAGVVMLVPAVRRRLLAAVVPMVRQTWPRIAALSAHPGRLGLAVAGNLVTALGWILAFVASLAAFGQHIALMQAAAVYFGGNAAGSVVPTPGGMGSIEVALIAGLSASGINAGVAASATVLFRVVTFWLQLPLGWAALRRLLRRRVI